MEQPNVDRSDPVDSSDGTVSSDTMSREKKPSPPSSHPENGRFTRLADGLWMLPALLLTLVLGTASVREILLRVGHPGAMLDDTYIHFQYARAIAEGHPFRFQAGEPISTGATSLLWPAILAPFYWIGFKGNLLLWPAWVISYASLFGLGVESARLLGTLVRASLRAFAACLVVGFGGLLWSAASGMEIVPFAFALTSLLRHTLDRIDAVSAGERPRVSKTRYALVIASAAWLRPEGWLFVLIACTLFFTRSRARLRDRFLGLVPFGPAVLGQLVFVVWSGVARSNTAQVKLLPGNPNFVGPILYEKVLSQIRTFYFQILNGEVWSAEFIPQGARPFFIMGLLSLLLLGFQRRQLVRASVVVALALAMLIPCVYYTFLWNRLRYLWPFMSGWLLSLVALAEVSAQIVSDLRRKMLSPRDDEAASNAVAFGIAGVTLGLFIAKVPGVLTDIGQSAFEIDGQQVKIGKWAATELPSNVRIGVNDTGAIAYFSGKKTFDIVGLTTTSESKYWVAGPGSRFEHYEKIHRSGMTFPTHFAVYPNWMGFDALFGESLFDATVPNATILGGETMAVYEADLAWLHSGERPEKFQTARITDELDVADLESEELHGYKLRFMQEGENVLVRDGKIADGGRTLRNESFRTKGEGTWISRVQCPVRSERACSIGGTEVRDSLPEGMSEVARIVLGRGEKFVACAYSSPCTVLHHWWVE